MGALFQDRLADWTVGRNINLTLEMVSALSELLKKRIAGLSHCELLLWQGDSWGRGEFGKPEEGKSPSLEAATKQGHWRRDCGH
jgi:hypothetical protein